MVLYSASEIIENSGPIVWADKENGILVSVNQAYFNVWLETEPGKFKNIEAFDAQSRLNYLADYRNLALGEIMDVASDVLDLVNGNKEEM